MDCSLHGLAKGYFHFKSSHQHFAWKGRILSLLLSLGIIFSLNIQNREAVGFTFKTSSKKPVRFGVLLLLRFLLFDFIFKMIMFPKGETFDLETSLFRSFFRVQRSFIINMEAVRSIHDSLVELTTGTQISIALNKKEEF